MTIKELKQLVELAALKREKSWDKTKAVYNMNLQEACEEACEQIGLDKDLVQPTYLLLCSSWNEALDWAAEK